jgi:hypothetical protein
MALAAQSWIRLAAGEGEPKSSSGIRKTGIPADSLLWQKRRAEAEVLPHTKSVAPPVANRVDGSPIGGYPPAFRNAPKNSAAPAGTVLLSKRLAQDSKSAAFATSPTTMPRSGILSPVDLTSIGH